MQHISLSLSPKQASKLRNGHKVRVKKGEGFNLIVHPTNYDIITRAFRKGKGAEIALSPEEIELNKYLTPEAHQQMREQNPKGEGLFKRSKKGGSIEDDFKRAFDPKRNGVAKAFDPKQNGVAKAFDPNQNGVAKAFDPKQNGVAEAFSPHGSAEKFGQDVKNALLQNLPLAKEIAAKAKTPEEFGRLIASELIHKGIPLVAQYGASALADMATVALGNPELAPIAGMVAGQAGKYGGTKLADYIGEKTGYGVRRRRGRGLKQDVERSVAKTRDFLGVGVRRGAGLSTGDFGIIAPSTSQTLDYLKDLDDAHGSHYSNLARSTLENVHANELGEHLNRMGINQRREAHNIMGNGVRVMPREGEYMPQALMSQPLSANYQFRHFFPVNFQLMTKESEGEFMHGMGLGLGLSAGRGKGLYL